MSEIKCNGNNIRIYCFLFNKGKLIFKVNESKPEFLLVSEAEELGIDRANMIYIGTMDSNDYYAANLSDADKLQGCFSKDLRDMNKDVDKDIYLLAFRALHFVNWINKNQYCGSCGEKLHIEDKKTFLECSKCGNMMYAFINPCIIVAVIKEDNILLARSPHFPPKLYSLLSGFVEAGEFLENAVRREVKEEVGIEIKNLKYIGSHPWPFSNSLMFGFTAEYSSGDIVMDPNEIEAADWFSFDNLPTIPDGYLSFARIIIDDVLESRKKHD